jgi:hypothetical protein
MVYTATMTNAYKKTTETDWRPLSERVTLFRYTGASANWFASYSMGIFTDLSVDRTFNVPVSVPTGAAASLYNARSASWPSGTIRLVNDDIPLDLIWWRRKIIYKGNHLGVIQQLTADAMTGTVDATFGLPNHLGPQDYIALQKAK